MPASRRFVLPGAPTILMAEADEAVADQVTDGLIRAGMEVVSCRDGAELLLQAGLVHPALVLLGTPLPVVDAARVTELLSRLSPVPVVVGVGPQLAEEAAAALSAGAVALVARPYRLREILPLLPRRSSDPTAQLKVGDIELDPAGLHVYVRGRVLRLPLREFELLRFLMQNTNRVVSRQQILRELWGGEHTDTNTLTVHIKRLRERIRTVEGTCCTIDTVRGLGYRLECPDEARTTLRS
ncbi:winged helix-turn-helix transcriptional regulator [Streptomyces sp. NPDC002402]